MTEYSLFNMPIYITWRAGTASDPYIDRTDTRKIVNNVTVLEEIPDDFYKVRIDGYVELDPEKYESTKKIGEKEFLVDYSNGLIMFNPSQDARTVTCKYKGKGFILYPALRIYSLNENTNVVENLQDIIDNAKIDIDDAHKAIDDAKKTTEDAKQTVELTKRIWKPFVPTYSDIAIEYPDPQLGWYVQAQDTGIGYRYDGSQWIAVDSTTSVSNLLKDKTIVFVFPSVVVAGKQSIEVRFPYKGTITGAYANVKTVGISRTVINIEKISQLDYDNGATNWRSIMDEKLIVEMGKKSSNTSPVCTFNDVDVNKNEHFRIDILEGGSEAKDLTIELYIQIQ